MTNTLTYLETLVRETHKPEAEVMTLAFQTGLKQLWREHILGRCDRRSLETKLSRM